MAGELDASTTDQLLRTVVDELPQDHTLILDLAGVTFCTSAGISALIQLRDYQRRAGHLFRLIHLADPVRRILEVTGLLEYLGVDETVTATASPEPPA